jgi:hypothetical protein
VLDRLRQRMNIALDTQQTRGFAPAARDAAP